MPPTRKRPLPKQESLSAQDRKLNHVAAEKKRRKAIRRGFDQITAVVPDLEYGQSRSEAIVLEKTVKMIRNLMNENEELRKLAEQFDVKIPPRVT